MNFIASSLREHQEIAIFLALTIGYLFGKITIGTFTFGPQIGSLLAGIVVSIWINSQGGPIIVPELVQNIFFSLFIFAMGFKVGPQFIQGVRGGGLVQVGLTVIFCVLALALSYIMACIFSFDKGLAAGFMAGTFSQSATVGSAMSAINNLSVSVAEKKELINNLAVAFAITNVIGIGGMPFWLINTDGTIEFKMYSIYSPPHHKDEIVRKTKKEAGTNVEEFEGVNSEANLD